MTLPYLLKSTHRIAVSSPTIMTSVLDRHLTVSQITNVMKVPVRKAPNVVTIGEKFQR